MKILITGSNGFLGKLLIQNLKNFNLVLLDKSYKKTLKKKYKVDLLNKDDVDKVFKDEKPSHVVHLASEIFDIPENQILKKNILAANNIIFFSKKYNVKKIIFTSTFSIYEKNYTKPITEKISPSAKNEYGKSKYIIEKKLIKSNIVSIIFRVPVIVSENRAHRMGIFFELIKNDLPLFLIGNGDNRIHFVSAAMLNYSIKKSLNFKKSNIYNIGSLNTIKLYDMFNKLIKKTNSKSKIVCLNKNLFNFIFNILKKLQIIDFNNYHKLMFSSNIVLDLSKIQKKLNLNSYKENNLDLMFNAYKYFCRNYKNIKNIKQGSDKFPDNKIIILIKFFKWLF